MTARILTFHLIICAFLVIASPAFAVQGCPSPAAVTLPLYVITQSSGNVAASTATATLPAPPAQAHWCVTQIEITGLGATSAAGVAPTISGLDGGAGASVTATYSFAAVAGATLIDTPLTLVFTPPLAGLQGTAVALSLPSLGTGNTNAAVNIHGFLQ